MEKITIKAYLNEAKKEIEEGRIIRAHDTIKFILENLFNRGEEKTWQKKH